MNICEAIKKNDIDKSLQLINDLSDTTIMSITYDRSLDNLNDTWCGCRGEKIITLLELASEYNSDDKIIDSLLEKGLKITAHAFEKFIWNNNLKYVERYLNENPDAKLYRLTGGWSPVSFVNHVCKNGQSDMLKLLMKANKFDPNHKGTCESKPIFSALENKHYDIYDLLVKCPDISLEQSYRFSGNRGDDLLKKYQDPNDGQFTDDFREDLYHTIDDKMTFTIDYLETIDHNITKNNNCRNITINKKITKMIPDSFSIPPDKQKYLIKTFS